VSSSSWAAARFGARRALSRFAWENRETVAEIDVNPLFALPSGAIAADALVIPRKK